jgi:uncharacterized membrane protein YvbJ
MTGWICKRCETANAASNVKCDVCDGPVLYTRQEFDRLLEQRLDQERKKLEKTYRGKSNSNSGALLVVIIVLMVLLAILSVPYFSGF